MGPNSLRRRKLKMNIFLFSVLMCIELPHLIQSEGRQLRFERRNRPWFMGLPNETLVGVPEIILNNEKYYKSFKDLYLRIIGRTGTSANHIKQVRILQKAQMNIADVEPFICNVINGRSTKRPTSVHKLRPGDIDIVAAMGDSLTAGNGGLSLALQHVAVENRGIAIMGGQANWRKFLTIPNILKEFNPKLFGYSLGDSFTHHPGAQFNIGELGAMSQDLPFMTRQLVKKIKKDPRVDFNNDWKLVTLLIGSNNFCSDICYLPDAFSSVEEHRRDLMKSFEFLRDNMPRTVVNLIISPNLQIIVHFSGLELSCNFMHFLECPCLFALPYKNRRKEFFKIMSEWQRVEEDVANEKIFQTKDDFTIIAQPFTKNLKFPRKRNAAGKLVSDLSYLSKDCFHFSQKGYCRASNALWNNMLEPVGSKTTDWLPEFQKFLCPSETHPYIFTWKNSNVTN